MENQSKIAVAIQRKLPTGISFKASKPLYEALNIKQKRFGQLMKGNADPYLSELQAISSYFKIDISELI